MTAIKQKIESIWREIANELLRQNDGKRIEEMLLPPAKELEISKFEEVIGAKLPLDYLLSLITHEGTIYWVWLWDAVALPSLSEVVDDWKANIKLASNPNSRGAELIPHGPVRHCVFDPLWIPFANDNGIPICLDLNPLPGGAVGQVIYVDWEDDTVRVVANSYVEFLGNGLGKMRKS